MQSLAQRETPIMCTSFQISRTQRNVTLRQIGKLSCLHIDVSLTNAGAKIGTRSGPHLRYSLASRRSEYTIPASMEPASASYTSVLSRRIISLCGLAWTADCIATWADFRQRVFEAYRIKAVRPSRTDGSLQVMYVSRRSASHRRVGNEVRRDWLNGPSNDSVSR